MTLRSSILLFGVLGMGMSPPAAAPPASDSNFASLRLYAGSWRVTRKDQPAGAKPDELKNDCAQLGKYFACQQTVNGSVSALLIFVSTDKPGHFFTQTVTPEGRATGRGDLQINGDHWVYSSYWDQGGKGTYMRTLNDFSGRDHIHFEQQESGNGKDWTTKNSGDETRVR
jgi:hypothetical protein